MKQSDGFLTASVSGNLKVLTETEIKNGYSEGEIARDDEVNYQLNRHEQDIFSMNRELITILTAQGIPPNSLLDDQLLTALDGRYTGTPVGVEVMTMLSTAPSGFLFEEGQLVSRATYPDLWDFANNNGLVKTDAEWLAGEFGLFSSGDGSTTFRLPDARGQFIRIHDNGAGVDPDAASRTGADTNGSVQDFAMENLVGTVTTANFGRTISQSVTGCMTIQNSGLAGTTSSGSGVRIGVDASLTNQTSTETRPTNIYRKVMIKY